MVTAQPRFKRSNDQVIKQNAPRAAQYLRVSTNNQRYSIENQRDAISEYAKRNGIMIVKSYVDPGRSGVTLRTRKALRQLIQDIQDGKNEFNTILVFDVSRWGRFQDTDESAHYEFLCKARGVSIQYCAEPFDNTANLANTVIKNMKRAMAGEYSRDLSGRVHRAQIKLAAKGFPQGGQARFGFRRLVVDSAGRPKGLLANGEHKYLATDKVVLVHGPTNETNIVREVFELFVEQRWPKAKIASLLNSRGIKNPNGYAWSGNTIDSMLRCEKYIGNVVYNQTSVKLGQSRVTNPKALWIRAKAAIKPIVSEVTYLKAQNILENTWPLTNNDLLDYMSSLWCRNGYLSAGVINKSPLAPSTNTFVEHFGSIRNAYRIVGYKPAHKYRYRGCAALMQKVDRQITAQIISDTERAGGTISLDHDTHVLNIDEHINIAVTIVPFLGNTGPIASGWRLYLGNVEKCHAILMVRLNRSNSLVRDYHLIPRSSFLTPSFRFTDENIEKFSYYKIPDLSDFYKVYRRNWFSEPFFAKEIPPTRPVRPRRRKSGSRTTL